MERIKNKLVAGIGVNDSLYNISDCPYYKRWAEMLTRCYTTDITKYKPYKGCTVDTLWHTFSSFKAWMQQQDWKGKELDKDLLVLGNTVYSPTTCIFISKLVNNVIKRKLATRPYPCGVYYRESWRKPYVAMGSYLSKQYTIGSYHTILEAEEAYKLDKNENIRAVACLESPRIREALLQHLT